MRYLILTHGGSPITEFTDLDEAREYIADTRMVIKFIGDLNGRA